MKFREKIREMTDESRECNIQITVGEKSSSGSLLPPVIRIFHYIHVSFTSLLSAPRLSVPEGG